MDIVSELTIAENLKDLKEYVEHRRRHTEAKYGKGIHSKEDRAFEILTECIELLFDEIKEIRNA